MMQKTGRDSLTAIAVAMCAALYAAGSFATAYIPSPWGFGQFRPAVVIPAFFAVEFGPIPAGVGAALGTLIADSFKHGYLYPGSLIAAVPGNFLGFYLFGHMLKKRFTWGRFIIASHITLTLANLVVAFLYVTFYKLLYLGQLLELTASALVLLIIGLTMWWFVTMLPFVLIVTPPLIRGASAAFPSLVREDVRLHSLQEELPERDFALSLIAPGVLMLLMAALVYYSGLGVFIEGYFGATVEQLITLMSVISGGALTLTGSLVMVKERV
jgi:hypothetical protein